MIKYETGSTYHVPPGTLLLERNIREAKPDKELIDSITAFGVLEPIGAVVNADGALLVRSGHRRTLAALEAKAKAVPVYVRGTDDLADDAEVVRIVQQRDENTHRAGLTTAEELGVVDQLTAFGLSAEEIVAQARIGEERVATARRISGSKLASKAAVKWQDLDLEQVAAIAEFDEDPKDVQALVAGAREGKFEHVLQRLRDDRADVEKRAACIETILAAGVDVLEEPPSHNDKVKVLRQLEDATSGKEYDEKSHADCPGHVGWAAAYGYGTNRRYEAAYGCRDPKKHGHKDRYASTSSRTPTSELSDAEREKAAKARRLVVENNKAWASAATVRRQWVLDHIVAATTAPTTTPAFLAVAVSQDGTQLGDDYKYEADNLTRQWLKLPASSGRKVNLAPALKGKGDARCLVVVLVHVIAAYEIHAMHKNAWREDGTGNRAGRYLRFLQTAGYPLSDVEKFALSKKVVR